MAGQFNMQFVADTSQSDAKIKQQIQYIQDLERNVRRMGGTFEYAEQEDLEFAKSLGQMQSRATSAKGRVNEMSNAINEMRIFYKRMSEAERQAPIGKAMSRSIQQATQTLRQYRNELNSVSAAQQRMQMSSAASAVGGGISRGALSAVTRGTMYATGMGGGLAMVGGSVAGLGAAAGPAAAVILAVTGLVKATKSAVEVNTEFEQSSANLAAVLGKSRDEIKMLTGDAMRLGSATKYTANEITELQTVLARRGFNETQIKAMTGDITKLATATATDLATSAELVGSTLQSFGLNAIEASRVASVLAVSTTKSALTVDKLATSMSYVSTLAHQFGLSIEDTAALLGVLSNSGLRASQVGTGLRNILKAIANDSSKLSRAMGMPIKNIDDFVNGLKKIKAEGANLGDIGAIIEVRAAPALARFADAADDITRMKEQLQDCVPLMDKMVNEQQNTFAYSMVHLKDEWQGLMLTFSESTGPLRSAADGLSAIIHKLKDIRLFNHGGDQEITLFEKGVNKDRAKKFAEKSKVYYDNPHYTGDGHIVSDKHKRKDEDAVTYLGDVLAPKEFKLKQMEAAYYKLQSEDVTTATAWYNYLTGGVTQLWDGGERMKNAGKQMNHDNVREQLAKDIAALRDEIADYNQAIGVIESEIAAKKGPGNGAGYRDKFGGKGKSPSENYQERALDIVDKALLRYEQELKELQNRLRVGLIDQAEFDKSKVRLDENVWEAYGRADMLEPMQDWKDGMAKWEKTMVDDADVAGLSETTKQMIQAREKYTRAVELATMMENQGLQDKIAADKQVLSALEGYWRTIAEINTKTGNADAGEKAQELAAEIVKLRNTIREQEEELQKQCNQRSIYNRALNSIESTARGNNIRYADIGVGGFKELINNNQMTDGMMEDAVKKLNEQLKTKGIRWTVQLDLESGTLEKLKSRLDEVFEGVGKGTGGVKSIVGALDSIKKAGESLEDTLEGDTDGWDKMMAVFNMAMAPLEAAVTIYEAINALKEMSAILSTKETAETIANTAAEGAEATAAATQTGTASAQAVANTAVAETSLAAAQGLIAEANAATAAAHASIPFAGPGLAAAGMATISTAYAGANAGALAATQMMHFADGGIVPGAYNGGRDTVPAMLTPGEIILNRAQQNTLATQLQPSRGYGDLHIEKIITGEDIRIVLTNNARRRGGTGKNYAI